MIRHIPDTIELRQVDGRDQWFIWNETTAGENFAEKWNRRPGRAEAFFTWHARFCADLGQLEAARGIDRLGDVLKGLFGSRPANAAIDFITERVSTARRAGNSACRPRHRPERRCGTSVDVGTARIPSTAATASTMLIGRRKPLTAAQQFVNLRGNPVSRGEGELRAGRFTYR